MRAWFADDDACRDYLDWLRWPHGFVCPWCGGGAAGTGRAGAYRCLGCRRRVSVTSRTLLDGTRVPGSSCLRARWDYGQRQVGS
ncbi:transposase [Actinomyces succiniciruminis]|uniref:transposase n=1 Tax=Actinomyces succiniciruminis TaxID=1522002 RepID=UPI002453FBDB|nr:transposase [Actinomyces succiniciruminis]